MIIYSALLIIKFKKKNIITAINVDPLSTQANYIYYTFKVKEVLWGNAPYMLRFVLRTTNSSQKDGLVLRSSTALTKDLDLVPSTHVG